MSPTLFSFTYFEDRTLCFCTGQPQTAILLPMLVL
jgi:hypothetical protein